MSRLSAILALAALPHIHANPVDGLFDLSSQQAGTAALPFLKMPVGARQEAMGGAGAADSRDVSSFLWNPAGIAPLQSAEAWFSHGEILGEWRHEAAAVGYRLPEGSVLGAGFSGLFATPFSGARNIDEEPQSISASDLSMSLGWARSWSDDAFRTGVRGQLLHSELAGADGWGWALDLGSQIPLPRGVVFGAALQNLSSGFSYYHGGTGVEEKIPTLFRTGLEGPLFTDWLTWGAGWSKSNDGWNRLHSGLEASFNNTVWIRAGREQDLNFPGIRWWRGTAMGAGIRIGPIRIDYSLRLEGELGVIHMASATFQQVKPRRDTTDWMKLARAAWQRGDCKEASRLASRSLRTDPSDLEAIVLVQECEKSARIHSGQSLTLLLSANTNSQLHAVWDGGSQSGGLARRRTWVEQMRATYSQSLLLDAGEVAGLDTLADPMLREALSRMDYNAMLASGPIRDRLTAWNDFPWIASTSLQSRPLQAGAFSVMVVGIPPAPGAFDAAKTAQEFAAMRESWTSRPSAVVVLLDASFRDAEALATAVSGIDIIVLSGNAPATERPLSIGNTLVVCPGRRGTHMARLSAFETAAGALSWEYELTALDARVPQDPEIAGLLGEALLPPDSGTNLAAFDQGRSANLLYLRTASAGHDVYILDGSAGISFRATRKPMSISAAQAAWSRNSFLLVAADSSQVGSQALWLQGIRDKRAFRIPDTATHVIFAQFDSRENWIYYVAPGDSGGNDLFRMSWRGSEALNLSHGRLGSIQEFSLSANGYWITLVSSKPDGSLELWHAGSGLAHPVLISTKGRAPTSPAYNTAGNRLAWLEPDTSGGYALAVWNLENDTLQTRLGNRHINSFTWTATGDTLILCAGEKISDLRLFDLQKTKEWRLTHPPADTAISEASPRIQWQQDQQGVLYERTVVSTADTSEQRSLHWIPIDGRNDQEIVSAEGSPSLAPP